MAPAAQRELLGSAVTRSLVARNGTLLEGPTLRGAVHELAVLEVADCREGTGATREVRLLDLVR
jgi:hypothetical protein